MSSNLALDKTLMTKTHTVVNTTDSRIATTSLNKGLAQVMGMMS